MNEGREETPTLYPYQRDAVEWLAPRSTALLSLDMGLGKTAITIQSRDRNYHAFPRTAVVAPANARTHWFREFEKFSKYGVVGVQVYSFEYIANQKNKIEPFDILVIDEAHYLKSPTAKRTRAILGKEGLCRQAKKVWALTGTPSPNHAGELWTLLYTFGATALNYERFVATYCNTFETSYGTQIIGTKINKIPELREILNKTMLRFKAEDVGLQLPKLNFEDVTVDPSPVPLDECMAFIQYCSPTDRTQVLQQELKEQRTALKHLTNVTHSFSEGSIKALEGLAKSLQTLRMYSGLQKLQATIDIIRDDFQSVKYEKLVVFAIHRDVIELLRQGLEKAGISCVTLYGGTPADKRQHNIDKFQNGKAKVFIGNIHAAGVAITLTAANHIIFLEQDWVPGNNAQAAKRCHRIGQTKPVFIRVISLDDSIDQKVNQMLKRKTKELLEIYSNNPLLQYKKGDTKEVQIPIEALKKKQEDDIYS